MRATRTQGFTLLELLLAMGLFTILLTALLKLVDTSTTIWGRTDQARELSELGSATMDMLAADLHALDGGPHGDLLADWRLADLDRDGIDGAPVQRLRLVRSLDAAGLQRLRGADDRQELETFERALVEVAWVLVPGLSDDPDERALGTLLRGERLVEERESLSFFDPSFLGPGGKPVPGSLNEFAGGVLWFSAWFATQTTILHDGWELGDGLARCSASWDAWNRARPDPERSAFNQPADGMPRAKDVPLLPRRVRIELELERPRELRTRTRLADVVTPEATTFLVRDGRRLPEAGRAILVGDEWMTVLGVVGDQVSVLRARRATRAAEHPAGALVHFGWCVVREVPVDMTREDWDL